MLINFFTYRFNQIINYARIFQLRLLGCHVGKECNIGKIKVIGHNRIKIGNFVTIQDNVKLTATGYSNKKNEFLIQINDNNFIGYGSVIESNESVVLNSYCMLGPYCYITDSNHIHQLNQNQFAKLGGIYKEVVIKQNCWLGAHSIILPGVTINENSVIAANSTVLKNIRKCTLNAGTPAIEKRHNSETE